MVVIRPRSGTSAAEFRAALKSVGLRQRDLARQLGVAVTTVNRWATGRQPVPGYAVAFLSVSGKKDAIDPYR